MTDPLLSARFRGIALAALIAIYLVILAGGIVRASGAGLGCPDWPKCFGQWIPPTEESQLPPNYQQTYHERGYPDTRFNAVKTWTEYGNRLVGATAGLLVIFTVFAARKFRDSEPAVFKASVATLFAVGFQAWLGKALVMSNLSSWMITIHMLMAFVVICLLIYAIARSQQSQLAAIDATHLPPRFKTVLHVALGMTLLQIAMGTQIRHALDPLVYQYLVQGEGGDRNLFHESFPIIFYIHRSFSSIILFTNLWLAWKIYTNIRRGNVLFQFGLVLTGLVSVAIITGVTLDRLGFPAFVQPLHLLLANFIFGTQFFLVWVYGYAEKGQAMEAVV